MPARRFGRLALILALAAACGCGIPRPRFTSLRATVDTNGPAIVTVAIDPNGTTISAVHLEWGSRPSLEHGVSLTREDDVPQEISPSVPTADPLDVTWYFRPDLPPNLADGEVVDYQVRLAHSHPNGGTVNFWSQRRRFVYVATRPQVPLPPPPGPLTPAFHPATCSDTTVLVGTHPVVPDEGASGAVISSDGRFVAFTSTTAFDPADDNETADVYVMDLAADTVWRVSAFPIGSDTEGGSQPAISGDGRFVAFVSRAMFDPSAAPGVDQVYLWDSQAGSVVARVSANQGFDVDRGGAAPSISHDGRFVAFVSHTRFQADPQADIDHAQVYRWERNTSAITASRVVARVSANGGFDVDRGGAVPAVSGDGGFVTFVSRTRFAVSPQANVDVDQVYLWERGTSGVVRHVSAQGGSDVDAGGHAPSISADGRFVAFVSANRYPVDPQASVEAAQTYLWDRDGGGGGRVVARVTANDGVDVDRGGGDPSISADGRWVAFVSRTRFPDFETFNPDYDQVYLWDRTVGAVVTWISTNSLDVDRGGFDPSVSGDGRLTAFSSLTSFEPAVDLNSVVDAYVRCP